MNDFTQGMALGSLGQTMTGGQIVDRLSSGVPVFNKIVTSSNVTLWFPKVRDIGHHLLINQDCQLVITDGQKDQFQRMILILQQNDEGNFTPTLPQGIQWQGKQPFIDTSAGAITILEILSIGNASLYGRLVYG